MAPCPSRPNDPAQRFAGDPLAAVADAVGRLRYGAIVLTLHDGKLIQMEVTERQRFG